jgi:prolyl-tRNA synthetase
MASYELMYQSYIRIFQRLGIKAMPVEADTGVIGGKHSHEFMVPAEAGENEVVYCDGCGYAANIEKAVSLSSDAPAAVDPAAAIEKFATPGVVTIEALSQAPYSVPAQRQIKTLVYVVDGKVTLILMRGDHQFNETKLAAQTGALNIRAATADEIFAALGAHPGSLGAVGVKNLTVIADETIRGSEDMTTGANDDGFHFKHVTISRDIEVTRWAELRTAVAGELCGRCRQPLKIQRAIEVGHVFKLGTKYSEPLKALYLDESGKQQPAVMGCYGLGITRTLQAIVEQCNDKDGIVWPVPVAPYTVCVTPLSADPASSVMQLAEKFYAELGQQGVDVILDDRNDRPGVKFKDSELVGFPIRIGIGERSLAKGEVEIKRRGGELKAVKSEEAVAAVLALIKG